VNGLGKGAEMPFVAITWAVMSSLAEEERLKGMDSSLAALELTEARGRLDVGPDELGLLCNTTT
jgi:hypothetical protein